MTAIRDLSYRTVCDEDGDDDRPVSGGEGERHPLAPPPTRGARAATRDAATMGIEALRRIAGTARKALESVWQGAALVGARCLAICSGRRRRRAGDRWKAAYERDHGVDSASGDPLEHAHLMRMGASWKFLYMCRVPLDLALDGHEDAQRRGRRRAVVGEHTMPSGDVLRGMFRVLVVTRHSLAYRRGAIPLEDDPLLLRRVLARCKRDGDTMPGDDDVHDDDDDDDDDGDGERDHDDEGNDVGDAGSIPLDGRPQATTMSTPHGSFRGGRSNHDDDHGEEDREDFDDRGLCVVMALHGLGALVGADGTLMEGTFRAGLVHGRARVVGPDGEIFGRWRHGRIHGRALASTPSGWMVCATWKRGALRGRYFAHASHGEQFRCARCPGGAFEGVCRRGYATGDHVMERWEAGRLVDVESFRIAPVLDSSDPRLTGGALIEGCRWCCRWTADPEAGYEGYVYHPAEVGGPEFDLYCAYVLSPAAARALTEPYRACLARVLWNAQRALCPTVSSFHHYDDDDDDDDDGSDDDKIKMSDSDGDLYDS
jgi:hypothetical protein